MFPPVSTNETIIFHLSQGEFDSSLYCPHHTDGRASAEEIKLVLDEIYSIRYSSTPQTHERDQWDKRWKISLLFSFVSLMFSGFLGKDHRNLALLFIALFGGLSFFSLFCEKKSRSLTVKLVKDVVAKHNQNFASRGLRWQIPLGNWIELWKDYKNSNYEELRDIPLFDFAPDQSFDEESDWRGRLNNRYVPPSQF